MPEPDSYEQVTIQSFPSAFEANLAIAALGAEGIEAWLEGENITDMNWALTGAVGGVKLQVATTSESAAMTILDELQAEREANRLEEEEVEEVQSIDDIVRRALKISIFGLFIPPLVFFSIHSLRKIPSEEIGNSPSSTKIRFYAAFGISIVVLISFFFLFYAIITSPRPA